MHIIVRQIQYGSREYNQTLFLRDKVLRKPLGLQFSNADLEIDAESIHLAAFIDSKVVGCLILTPLSAGQVKMRQVAVDNSYQGSGVGRELVLASEIKAKEQGFTEIILSARDVAVPFYSKLGYTVVGELFTEVNIPHRKMKKQL